MNAFLLKVSNGDVSPVYRTLAGLRTTRLVINGTSYDAESTLSFYSSEPQKRMDIGSASISGAGVFTASASEARIKQSALSGVPDDYELSFESGERLRGKFLGARHDEFGADRI